MPNFLNTIKQNGALVSLNGHTHANVIPFQPWATRPYPSGGVAGIIPLPGGYYTVSAFSVVANVPSTNNASNYWIIRVLRDGTTVISTVSTATYAAGATIAVTNTLYSYASVAGFFSLTVTKTGSPGDLYVSASIKIDNTGVV